MKRSMGAGAVLILLSTALPGAAAAQVAWDSPSLMRPSAPAGLSVLLVDPAPNTDLGAMALWRRSPTPVGLGFRAGLANGADNELAAFFGLDVSGSLGTMSPPTGPAVMWWSGAGIGVHHDARISVPAGLVLGWSSRGQGVSFHPYVGGHVALDVLTARHGDIRLGGAVDLGVDLAFEGGWAIRFGASAGDRDALAIGVRLPGVG